jgi:hypothetical protein
VKDTDIVFIFPGGTSLNGSTTLEFVDVDKNVVVIIVAPSL